MRTPEQESDSLAHPIDPHPPREPRAICPPTPPPESGQGSGLDRAVVGYKYEDNDGAGATDGNSALDMAVAGECSLYMIPGGDDLSALPDASTGLSSDIDRDKAAKSDGVELNIFKADVAMRRQLDVEVASVPSPDSLATARDAAEIFHSNESSDEHRAAEAAQHGALTESPKSGANSVGCPTSPDTPGESTVSSTTPRFEFFTKRLYPYYPSSLLRPGSKFSGTQQSDHQVYNVDVQILTLSVPESSLTGYLRICGLTEDHPTLTTFFTGEIIGGPHHKYGFQTKHQSWGATDLIDLQHWAQFPAWRQLNKAAKGDISFKYPPPATRSGQARRSSPGATCDAADCEHDSEANSGWWRQPNVFMRWKEWFLVPDHRVTTIPGASFEGFYYICFSQVEGKINGVYFHGKSKKYQQLELNHKSDRGVCGAMEFR